VRILACADLHGRPDRIARVRALVTEHTPDVLVLPGDLTHAGSGEEALTLLHTLPVPVLAIPGNMDTPAATGVMRRHGALLVGPPRVIAGITFGGPDVASSCDVLVVHEPPVGILDTVRPGKHIGSTAVHDQILRLRPRVVTCGHVHESPGIAHLEGTLVINCTMGDGKTAGALIDLSPADATARLL